MNKLSSNEKNILSTLSKEHLTSVQILNRVESISLILKVYSVLEDSFFIAIFKQISTNN